LAERYEIEEAPVADPPSTVNEFLPEMTEMGNRPTKGGHAKAEEDQEDLDQTVTSSTFPLLAHAFCRAKDRRPTMRP
jgi:hypothetical protein